MDLATHSLAEGSPAAVRPTVSDNTDALVGVYEQICNSHQAIDEFRMKLLGLLPLTSLAGIFLLGKSDSVLDAISASRNPPSGNPLIAFVAIFAAAFTLALFVYEIRGILRCHGLIEKGRIIEKRLNITGQFSLCHDEHESAEKDSNHHFFFNTKVAACFTYSLVFAAWLFLALHRGFNIRIEHCTLWALASGLLLGFVVHALIQKRIAP